MRRFFVLFSVVLFVKLAYAQDVSTLKELSGVVLDAKTKEVIPEVVVTLKRKTEGNNLFGYSITDAQGRFLIKVKSPIIGLFLSFSSLGYETKTFDIESGTTFPIELELRPSTFELKEVVVKGKPIVGQGDTISYNASSFLSPSTRSLEDLIARLPGLTVEAGGKIKYQGKSINKLYIEGLDLLENRYALATQNIQASDIQSIQVLENHQPIKMLQDLIVEELASLNIKLKKDRLSKLKGHIKAMAGSSLPTENTLWGGDLFAMKISRKKQNMASIVGNNFLHANSRSFFSNMKKVQQVSIPLNPFPKAPIPKSKYQNPRTFSASFGTIKKITNDKEYKYNLCVQKQSAFYQTSSRTEYFTPNGKRIIEEVLSPEEQIKSIEGDFTYTKNSDRCYLQDRLVLGTSISDSETAIMNEKSFLRQQAQIKELMLDNQFSYKRKNSKGSITSFDNTFSLSAIPSSHFGVPEVYTPYAYAQTSKSLSAQTYLSGSYLWRLSDISSLSFSTRGDFVYSYFKSNLNDPDSENDTQGGIVKTISNLSYQIMPSSWNITLNLHGNLDWMRFRYLVLNQLKKETFTKVNPYWGTYCSAFCKVTSGVKFYVRAGMNHSKAISMSDFILNPIRNSYLMVSSKGEVDHPSLTNYSSSFSLDYSNPLIGLFSSFSLGYMGRTSNWVGGIDVDDSGISSYRKNFKNNSNHFNGRLFTSYHMYPLNTILSVEFAGDVGKNTTFRNKTYLKVTSNSYQVTGTVSSNPYPWLTMDVRAGYHSIGTKIESQKQKQLFDYTVDTSLSFCFIPDLYWTLAHNYLFRSKTDFNNKTSYSFFQSSVRYVFGDWECELSADNILNESRYEEYRVRDFDLFHRVYDLRPRKIVLKVVYTF